MPARCRRYRASRSQAATIAADMLTGFALPCQAMSNAVPWSTEVRRTGSPDSLTPVDGQFLFPGTIRDANETDFTNLFYQIEQTGFPSDNQIDVLGFDVVGIEFYYWYYNYAIAADLATGQNYDNDGDGLIGEDPPGDANGDGSLDDDFDGRIDEDPDPVRDAAALARGPWRRVRGNWESSVECYPNEPEDVNSIGLFDADRDVAAEQRQAVRKKAIERMDGLPEMVEIRIFVLDRERHDLSVRTSTIRVRVSAR